MSSGSSNFQIIDRGNDWLELCFNQLDSKANVFTESALRELDNIVKTFESTSKKITGLLVTSGKNDIFVAGADINLIKNLDTYEKALEGSTVGQQIIHRISKLPFETVAAINGACLGGGFELALGCKKRIAADGNAVKIGLPEVNLGILPGFGGCVRLPRLVGLAASLDLILSGKQLDGKKAWKLGIVSAVLPVQDFNRRALDWAKANAGKPAAYAKRGLVTRILEGPIFRGFLLAAARKQVLKKTAGHYPSPIKILELLGKIQGKSIEDALKLEAQFFAYLAITPVSKRLIELFQLAESVKKTNGVGKNVTPHEIARAAVLGAGVMGGGIAQAFAKKAIPIRMKDLSNEALALGYKQASEVFSFDLKRKKMTPREFRGKMALITGSLNYSGFGNVDIVVEAVVENMDVKKKVLKEVEAVTTPACIFASNTSSLSISEMQSVAAHPERVGGLHFFNPVHRMPLVEVIVGDKTSPETTATLFELSKRLGKTPIVVNDGPGFLVNRLLLPYMNEALFILEAGIPIDRIDRVMLKFGMPMGPLRLVDEVGMDVAAKVAHILHDAFGERALCSTLSDRLVKSGRLGRKNGKGFYLWENGKAKGPDESIYSMLTSTKRAANFTDAELIERMVYPMINEAALLLDEGIVATPGEVDLGMIFGTGFPPFRGGVLRHADSVGVQKVYDGLQKFYEAGYGDRLKPNDKLLAVARRGGFYK